MTKVVFWRYAAKFMRRRLSHSLFAFPNSKTIRKEVFFLFCLFFFLLLLFPNSKTINKEVSFWLLLLRFCFFAFVFCLFFTFVFLAFLYFVFCFCCSINKRVSSYTGFCFRFIFKSFFYICSPLENNNKSKHALQLPMGMSINNYVSECGYVFVLFEMRIVF